MIVGTNYGFIRGQRLATLTELNGKANSSHNHSASNITSGTLGVARGGTGRSTLTSGYFLRGNGTGAVTMSSISEVQSALGISGGGGSSFITWYGPYSRTITLTKQANNGDRSAESSNYTISIGGTRTIDIFYGVMEIQVSGISVTASRDDVQLSQYIFLGNYSGGVAWRDYYQISFSGYHNETRFTSSDTGTTRTIYRKNQFDLLVGGNNNYPNPNYKTDGRIRTNQCSTHTYIQTENSSTGLTMRSTMTFMLGTCEF